MPNTPINNLIVQNAGVAQTGLLMGNGTSPVSAAIAANVSAALDLIGGTQGNVLYRSATGWTVLAPGTSGQFLRTAGAGADPIWATVSATGDVVGPASSVDDRIATFSLTSGKIIKDASGITALAGTLATASGNLTLAPVNGSEVMISNTQGGVNRLLEIFGTSANYTQFNVGRSSTRYFTSEWDNVAGNGNLSTYSLAFPIRIRASQIELATGGSDTNRLIVDGSGAIRFTAYGLGALQSDASGNVTATQDIRTTASPTFAGLNVGASAPLSTLGSFNDGASAAALLVTMPSTWSDQRIRLSNSAAFNVSNLTGFDMALNTSSQARTAFLMRSAFNDVTDATRTSYASFLVATSGSVSEVLRLMGSGIQTSSPTGSTARPFKVGDIATAVTPAANRLIKFELNGTVYELLAKTP